MAYNVLSGTVIAAEKYLPGDLMVNVVSGNLSTSDGSSVINVPRVSNATNNSILTNVGGDANTLTCESNLTFDGGTLNVTGEITASTGISASFLMGDGSRLTNLPGGGGSGGGIFTQTAGNNAYTTSSIQLGSAGTAPATLSVVGGSFLSGALIHKRHTVTDDYTISTTDYYVGIDTTGGTVKITLPNAAALTSGQTLVLKDEGGNSHTNAITISGSGADKIDGQNTVVLGSPYAALQLYCDGAAKYFIY